MNLIEDPWIPARRRSGVAGRIAPWELTEGFDTDPWVEVAAPRPDFDGALVQFLIGLLQTCLAPADPHTWRSRPHPHRHHGRTLGGHDSRTRPSPRS